jgi:sodium/potassium-transporting ATPase subunit alpha
MACRSNRQSALSYLMHFNSWIIAGLIFEVVFIFTVVNAPLFHAFFTTSPIPAEIWLVIMLAPLVIFIVEELRKGLVRREFTILSA